MFFELLQEESLMKSNKIVDEERIITVLILEQ
jgi:hypothetical protein